MLQFEGILPCWCFVLKDLIEAFVDSSSTSSPPYHWPRNVWVTRFGDKMYEDLDDARMLPGIKDLGGQNVWKKRYINKKIFQGLDQMVLILLTSTGIPMRTFWCNLARNTSYCTRWAYLILRPNIGKNTIRRCELFHPYMSTSHYSVLKVQIWYQCRSQTQIVYIYISKCLKVNSRIALCKSKCKNTDT